MAETTATWTRFLDARARARPLSFFMGVCHDSPKYCVFHSHAAIEIVYHRAGNGVTRLDTGQELSFAAGSIVIYAPEERHDQTTEIQGQDLCVQVAVPKGKHAPRGMIYIDRIESASILTEIEALARGRTNIAAREKAILDLRATTLLMRLLHAKFSTNAGAGVKHPSEAHVLRAEQYVRDKFQSIRSMEEIAQFAGISHHHLRHLFKARRGKSLIRHLNETRIEFAKSLLVRSQLPMKQIATLCGFKDEYYFSTVFRGFVKQPPLRYRREA